MTPSATEYNNSNSTVHSCGSHAVIVQKLAGFKHLREKGAA